MLHDCVTQKVESAGVQDTSLQKRLQQFVDLCPKLRSDTVTGTFSFYLRGGNNLLGLENEGPFLLVIGLW